MSPIIATGQLHINVAGTPAPQGSKRIFRGIPVESSRKVRPWREAVRHAAELAIVSPYPFEHDPVKVTLGFLLARPKAHYRTGAHANELRAGVPMYAAKLPDLDKLVRSTLDALSDAGVWYSDAQVVSLYASKMYATTSAPGVDILIGLA